MRSAAAALALAVVMAIVATVAVATLPRGAASGAARGASPLRPAVVETATTTVDGPGGHGVPGPAGFGITLPQATQSGDLLVAAIVDGVAVSGMTQPTWRLAGWRLGEDVIGGETATDGAGPARSGGLQVAIWYRADAPAGIRSVDFGQTPSGTQAAMTAVVAELSGAPSSMRTVAVGSSTSGPSSATDTHASDVTTAAAPSVLPAIVLAAFTNGGTTLAGQQFIRSPGWRLLGQDPNRHGVDQPVLFDERVWDSNSPPAESMRYLGGSPIDNCAAIVALG